MNDVIEHYCCKSKNCCNCGKILSEDEMILRTNIYDETVEGDNTLHRFCDDCWNEFADDI